MTTEDTTATTRRTVKGQLDTLQVRLEHLRGLLADHDAQRAVLDIRVIECRGNIELLRGVADDTDDQLATERETMSAFQQ